MISRKVYARLYRIVSTLVFVSLLLGMGGGGVSAAPIGAPGASSPVTGETTTIEPAGQTTWAELVAHEASHPRPVAEDAVFPAPFMPAPPLQDAGDLAVSAPESLPISAEQTPEQIQSAGTLVNNFSALGDNATIIPPDTMGAVGPNHLMTMLNSQVMIQQKDGTVLSIVSLSTFWTSGTGLTGTPFDPRIIYDSLSGRWMAVVDANARSSSSAVWFAISAGNDPTGTWTYYSIQADPGGTYWADYPDIGVNTPWVAITNNMYTVSGSTFGGAKMWVIDKAQLLAGNFVVTTFARGFDGGGFTLRPALTFDASEPTLYLVDGLWMTGGTMTHRVSQIRDSSGTPVWSSVGFYLVNSNYDITQINAAQLGDSRRIQTNDTRLLNAVFRNGHLWLTHTGGLPVGSVDRTAVFWYEVNPVTPAIVQSGVIDGGVDVHHYFPSISVNQFDEVVIGFTRSDATRYAQAVFVSRQPTDPAGWTSPIQVIKMGEDSYAKDFGSGRIRWGDYSATAVDPLDDQTLWTLQEYAVFDVGPTDSDDRWGTWWGKVQFEADMGITKTVTFGASNSLTYDITVTNYGPADATGVTVQDPFSPQLVYVSDDCGAGAPVGGIWTWNAPDVTLGTSVTCHLDVTLASGVTGWVNNIAYVLANQVDHNSWNDSGSVAFSVPQAIGDNYMMPEDTPLNVLPPGILGNDLEPDGDPLSAVLGTDVSHGTLTLQSNGGFIYSPDADFNGVDMFTYRASDGYMLSPTATVTITVTPINDAPIALNDVYTTGMNIALNEPAPGVLANDSDPDMDPLSAILFTPPITGTLSLHPNGAFDFTPPLDFTGTVTFTYQADDGFGGLSPTATVTITVTPVTWMIYLPLVIR